MAKAIDQAQSLIGLVVTIVLLYFVFKLFSGASGLFGGLGKDKNPFGQPITQDPNGNPVPTTWPDGTPKITGDQSVDKTLDWGNLKQVDQWTSSFSNWLKGLFGGKSPASPTTVQQGYPANDYSSQTANYGSGDISNYLSSTGNVDELTQLDTYSPDLGQYGVLTPWS